MYFKLESNKRVGFCHFSIVTAWSTQGCGLNRPDVTTTVNTDIVRLKNGLRGWHVTVTQRESRNTPSD